MVLLTTSMFVGGVIAFVLDNTMPGSDEDRGLLFFRGITVGETAEQAGKRKIALLETYDLPFGRKVFAGLSCIRRLPFCPKYPDAPEEGRVATNNSDILSHV